MMELSAFENFIYGLGAFVVSFLFLSFIWSLFIRLSEKLFSRSKFFFVPTLLRESSFAFLVITILLSIYSGIYFFDKSLLEGFMVKVWGTLLILAITEGLVRFLLGFINFYYKRQKEIPDFIRRFVPTIRNLTGIVFYSLAVLMVISFLNFEVGSVLTIISILLLIFLFLIFFDSIKNTVSGIQLNNQEFREGDLISIYLQDNIKITGFIEKILPAKIQVRTFDGSRVFIPNSKFLSSIVRDNYYPPDGNLLTLKVVLDPSKIQKAEEKLRTAINSVVLESDDVFKDYQPKITSIGYSDSNIVFLVRILLSENADVLRLLDKISTAITKSLPRNSVISLSPLFDFH